MELELHRLELRYAALRIVEAGRRARLVASLARHGQHSPALVVTGEEDRFVLVDGYARVEALRELGQDVVKVAVLELSEPEALLLTFRLEAKQRRSALEQGWLIAELIERHGWSHRAVAARLHRSASWVCRRLALARTLPGSVQAAVKSGLVPAHAAEKYLAPLARANTSHCERLVAGLGRDPVSVREVERLYLGWKRADPQTRERIVTQPRLYLQAEAAVAPEPAVPEGDPAGPLLGDLDGVAGCARRARRRVREGVLHELDDRRRTLVTRTAQEARLSWESLAELLELSPCSTSTPAPRS